MIPLPPRLSTIEHYRAEDAVNRKSPRSFALAMQGMVHTISNRLFETDAVAQDGIVRLGDLELGEFANLEDGGGGMGMGMMNVEMLHFGDVCLSWSCQKNKKGRCNPVS